MINVNSLIQKLIENGTTEISSFELALIMKELSFGYHTKFDEYLDDWISGKVELERMKSNDIPPRSENIMKHSWDDLFI